jgi:hypothetical protein
LAAALGPGPLTEERVREHVAPLFSRTLAANRGRIYLANHSLGRPLAIGWIAKASPFAYARPDPPRCAGGDDAWLE